MLSHDDEVIIAQCTPKGSGALALLRLTGLGALELSSTISLLPSGESLHTAATHTIKYGWVVDSQKNKIDQVLFLVMHGPKTFTGQDTVEITCHNNPFLINSIITEAISHGARFAQEGEFSKRAVLNNKIDLTQAEAINELINAQTQHALKKSLAQLSGSFSQMIQNLEKKIIKALAFSEASFEFIDEDMEFSHDIITIIVETIAIIGDIKKMFDQQQHIREGIRIALIGSVNAGKSSLFNALLDKERAIVTDIAGTTRDIIEASLHKNGNYWTLIDTAGLRQTDDIIEQAGIERSHQAAHSADIILLIYDGSRNVTNAEYAVYHQLFDAYKKKIILVQTKADKGEDKEQILPFNDGIKVSAKMKHTIALVEDSIEQKIRQLFDTLESPFLLNQRQFNLLVHFEKKLRETLDLLREKTIGYEIISYHLNDALAHLSELTGKSISEAGMDAVFRDFCVGK